MILNDEYNIVENKCIQFALSLLEIMSRIREGVHSKQTLLNGHRPFFGGDVDPRPAGLVLFLPSNST